MAFNLYGRNLTRFLRVAEDLKVAERLGVSEIEGARILLLMSQDEALLRRELKAKAGVRTIDGSDPSERSYATESAEDSRQVYLPL